MSYTTEDRTDIVALAVGVWGAAPGFTNLNDLAAHFRAGGTRLELTEQLTQTAIFEAEYPPSQTDEEFAQELVDTMVGGFVDADAEEWAVDQLTSQLNAGASKAQVILGAIDALRAVDAENNEEWGTAKVAFENKVDVAEYYSYDLERDGETIEDLKSVVVNVDETEESVEAARADAEGAAEPDNVFTLTIAEDNLVGAAGDDLFNAPITQDNVAGAVASLESFDVLDGGAGTDTLSVSLANNTATPAPVLQNIENVQVRFTGDDVLDLDNASGVESLVVRQSSAAGTVNNAGGVDLTVQNQTQDVTVNGLTGSSKSLTFNNADATVTGAGTAVTSGTISTTESDITLAGAALTAFTSLTVAAEGENELELGAAGGTVTDLTVNGDGEITFDTAFTVLETLNGGSNTGGIVATVDDTATEVTTGAGDDEITYTAAIAAESEVSLGDGDDELTIAGASAASASVDGGAGDNTLVVTDGTHLNAAAASVYTNFQTLGIGGGTGTYDMEALPGLTAVSIGAGLVGAVVIDNAEAGTTISATGTATDLDLGSGLTYNLADASGSDDALSLSLTAIDILNNSTTDGEVTVPSLTANGIETVNISASVLNLADAGTTNAGYTHTITSLNADAAETITVSGNASLVITDSAGAVTSDFDAVTDIDASGLGGGITIDMTGAAAAVEFTGGAGDDTYTASANGDIVVSSTGQDTYTFAAGEDTLVYTDVETSVLNIDGDAHDIVASFTAGSDTIDLGSFAFSGQQSSALANKGALGTTAADVLELSESVQEDFFVSGGAARGVATGNDGTNTYVFIDADKNGDFDASADMVIQLNGMVGLNVADFGF